LTIPAASTVVILCKYIIQGLEQWQAYLVKLNGQ
jgi:hypothetical protein